MATSVVAEGKALVALKGGKPLPEDAIVSEDGTITGDPKPLYEDTQQGMFPNPNNGSGALRAFEIYGVRFKLSYGNDGRGWPDLAVREQLVSLKEDFVMACSLFIYPQKRLAIVTTLFVAR